MSTTEQTKEPIRLRHDSGKVVVEDKDEDRFVLTAQAAIKACKDAQGTDEVIRGFKEAFLKPVIAWCEARADRVKGCYLPFPDPALRLFVVTRSERYDFVLSEELSALTIQLTDGGWFVSAVLLPDAPGDELATFFNLEEALEVYAQLPATQGESPG